MATWDEFLAGTRITVAGARREDHVFCANHTGTRASYLAYDLIFDWEVAQDPGGSRGAVRLVMSNVRHADDSSSLENLPFDTMTRGVTVINGEPRITPSAGGGIGRLDAPQTITELPECPIAD